MLNLARPRPVQAARQTKVMRFELCCGLCVFALGCIMTWHSWPNDQVMPSLPLPKAPPIATQPLHQHFTVWQLLHQNRPPSLQISQLEYASQQWLVQLFTNDLAQFYDWQEKLQQEQRLSIELQQSQTSNQGYRIRLAVSLL
ncbi:hypothetical protein CWE09_12010 [Aliidiomarina minuta]|uniref:Uncharacterized protein n=1 Tax=Aliidiomarina minuta TaxID=880057 RepID=A0A432W3G7_9GAMM|nr:hypothetical protein [Aliidiomarina minuta]RUO23871.1 hypothetical protein CWE09_12010 [Aliidiomarina minuta]